MSIPNFPDKHKSRPIVTPQQHVAYFRQQGFIPDFPIPESIILNLFTWISTYKFLIITAIWRIMQYDTHKI